MLNYVNIYFNFTLRLLIGRHFACHEIQHFFFCFVFIYKVFVFGNILRKHTIPTTICTQKNCIAFAFDIRFRYMNCHHQSSFYVIFSILSMENAIFVFLNDVFHFFEISFHFKFIIVVRTMIESLTGHI